MSERIAQRKGTGNIHPKPKRRDRWQMFNDELDKAAIEQAAKAAVEQLKRTDTNRMIKTLTKPEIEHFVIGTISAYVKARAEQAKVAELAEMEEMARLM